MELQQEQERNQELMNMIDATRKQGKILTINQEDGEDSYIGFGSYLYDTEEHGEVYMLFVPHNFPNSVRLSTKEWLHDTVLKQDRVELVDTEEIDEDHRETVRRWEDYGNPREEVHIVVKTTDDGRYKDQFKLVRKGTDKRNTRYIGGHNDEDSKFEYIDLGSFKEVVEGDKVYDFDLKPFAGGVPIDYSTLTTEEERQLLKNKLSGDVKESNGGTE